MTPFRSLRYTLGLTLGLMLVPLQAGAVTRTCGSDAVANTANVLCAAPSGPCTGAAVIMSENIDVTNGGCTFDLGGRTLEVRKTFQMIGSGFITVTNAGNITITSTGKLKARGDFVMPNGFIIGGGNITLTSSGTITHQGVIDVSGDSAGLIRFTAAGDVSVASGASIVGVGDTLADEGERYADGGSFDVVSNTGGITINAPISLIGNNQATGGSVSLIAAKNVSVTQAVDATGGGSDGGEIEIIAGDDISVTKDLDVSSRVGGGFGGAMTLTAGVDTLGGVAAGGGVTINNATLKLSGSDTDTSGGDGGDLEITGVGPVRLIGNAVAIRADAAASFYGDGGTVFIASTDTNFFKLGPLDGDLEIGGLISMRSGGDGGSGGTLELSAGRDLTLTASVDVSGKSGGGDVSGDAGRAVRLAGVMTAQANDVLGDGGSVDFVAGLAQVANLTVAADVLGAGGANNGSGQDLSFSGCSLTVEAGIKIDGHAGVNANNISGGSDIDLISRTPMQLKAGSQYLAYPVGHVYTIHPPGQDPVIGSGVTFNPSRSDRPTTTGGYANCPVCGDGDRASGEACDDGDLSGGDGCAADCTVEPGYTCTGDPSVCTPTCGDGVVLPPEQCDDGDLTAGDGCGPTCVVEPGWTCVGIPSVCVQTCGDGIVAPGEECDDNNLVSGDGCDANCRFTACGNGIATTGEDCDDGNNVSGDCCSPLCAFESPGSACASDGNGCTDDVCNATGTCVHANNTQPCADDGNICTNDVCGGGACTHPANPNPLPCADDGNGCTNDVCSGGVCSHPANSNPCADDGNGCTNDVCGGGACTHPANTAPCNDGNACTQTDTCSNKVCVGANPVVCTALDQCHLAGTCAPGTGVCSNPNKANGSACNDSNACTQTDTCQTGACTGANPKVCTALDQCHVAGTCAPGTGICSNPNKADGSACNDSNACTQTDTCQTGACTGGNPKVCTPSDQCHIAGTCAPATGNCSNPIATNGTSCNDANVCTRQDVCTNGSCVGDPNICNDGIHQSTCGELCDDGNTVNGDGCDSNCTPTACGNGIRTAAEQCDDGDTTNGDGCSSTCTVEPGWTCSAGSPSTCTEVCGDGIQTPGEECEDGNVQPRDGCSPTCKFELCGALPASGCLLPIESGKASLQLKAKSTPDKDILSWKWLKGPAVPKSMFGNPRVVTDYAVCLYDENGGTPHLKLSVTIPHAGFCKGRECWRDSSSGFKYNNSAVFPDGKMKMVLKEGLAPGAAKIIVKGKGSHLILPATPLNKSPRVRLQLRNSNGVCWEANYSTAAKNLPGEFKAKAD